MLPAKVEVPVMAKTMTRRNLEGSASSVAPAVTLPPLLPGGGARGSRFPPADLLSKRRTVKATLTLVIRGEVRVPS